MTRTGLPAHRHVASVSRALDVLFALADGGHETGTNEIARRTGINASTVSRLLATLASAGLVEHVAETGRYRLGIRLVQLGNAVLERLDLREVARAHLHALARETEETVTLSAPGDGVAVTVDFVRSPSSVQSVAQVGRPSIVHATATGKVMMAFGCHPIPSGPFERLTPRTITDPAAYLAEVERVRARGWAQTIGEREEDLNAVAVPVWESRNQLAAILGVQGPASRFNTKRMRTGLVPLREHAEEISLALGWQRPS